MNSESVRAATAGMRAQCKNFEAFFVHFFSKEFSVKPQQQLYPLFPDDGTVVVANIREFFHIFIRFFSIFTFFKCEISSPSIKYFVLFSLSSSLVFLCH